MRGLRDAVRLARGSFFRLALGVRAGRHFRVGSGSSMPRRTLTAGDNVTIGDRVSVSGVVSLGSGVVIHRDVILRAFDGHVEVGEGTTVNPFCIVYGQGGVDIGALVSIAAGTKIVAQEKVIGDPSIPTKLQGGTAEGIRIGDDVWIGVNAVVLDGVSVGEGAVVGAGSVVTRDVEPFTVVAGVPARVLRSRG